VIGQVVSLLGAAMILVAFAAQQARKLSSDGPAYLALNFAGAAIMTYFAIASKSSGLIALEGSWALISLVSLVKAVARGKTSSRPS